jgi:hypothetical protein
MLFLKRDVIEVSCVSHSVLSTFFEEFFDFYIILLSESLLGELIFKILIRKLGSPVISRLINTFLLNFLNKIVDGFGMLKLTLTEKGRLV